MHLKQAEEKCKITIKFLAVVKNLQILLMLLAAAEA
jgi:hypothetical protein